MATPRADSITVPSGTTTVRLGRQAPAAAPAYQFDSVTYSPGTAPVRTAAEAAGQILVLELHANGGFDPAAAAGGQYTATNLPASMSAGGVNSFFWHITRKNTDGVYRFYACPLDKYGTLTGTTPRQSRWAGFANIPDPVTGVPDPKFQFVTHRRIEALVAWLNANAQHDPDRLIAVGTSMGSYGVTSFAMRRPDLFAACYIDITQFLMGYDSLGGNKVQYADWSAGWPGVLPNTLPDVSEIDGGGNLLARLDHVSWLADPANETTWLGISGNKDDVNNRWEEYEAVIAALRALKRPFAFRWATNGHSSMVGTVASWVPFDMHKRGRGLPYFFDCSTDSPLTASAGTINGGLQWQSVVETPGSFSCQIRNTLASCTVDVLPHSKIFTATVAAQNKTLPQGAWVDVSFTA